MMTRCSLLFAVLLCQPILTSAQTYSPLVTMRVTAPDGTTQEISARESSVAAKSKPNFKVAILNIEAPKAAKT